MSVVMLTKTPLQANMSYIQAGRDRFESGIPAGSVSGLVWADKAGTLYLEESDDDGVTWSQTTNVSVSASTTTVLPWTALTKQQYRFRYVNGAAAQTKFRLVQQTRGMELTTVDLSPLENRIDAITSGDTPATAQLTGSNIVESITHDDFNANANLQIGNEDVDDENPVPAKLVGSIIPDSQAVPTKLTGSILDKVDLSNQLLASINHGQLSPIAISSWQEIQYIVRSGLGPKVFRVGDQFISQYDTGEVVWDVIGIDHDTPSDAQFQHSLTLQAHDCIGNVQFDAPEALYYAEEELPAGEQVFTDSGGDKYKFTTTLPVPSGGQIVLGGWPSEGYVATTATTYAADRITIIESGITVIPTDTGADTLTEVNNRSRCRYGSNNYVESAIKQWLNSEATSFNWVPKTNFDRPPTGAPYTGAGFLKLLDPELVSVLGAVDKQVTRNTITDGGGQDLFSDKVFLLSRVEVFGGTEGTTTGEQAYPYYSTLAANPTTAALAGRIKYLDGSARVWWLRSPYTGNAHDPRYVNTTGAVSSNHAVSACGAAPACCIV